MHLSWLLWKLLVVTCLSCAKSSWGSSWQAVFPPPATHWTLSHQDPLCCPALHTWTSSPRPALPHNPNRLQRHRHKPYQLEKQVSDLPPSLDCPEVQMLTNTEGTSCASPLPNLATGPCLHLWWNSTALVRFPLASMQAPEHPPSVASPSLQLQQPTQAQLQTIPVGRTGIGTSHSLWKNRCINSHLRIPSTGLGR